MNISINNSQPYVNTYNCNNTFKSQIQSTNNTPKNTDFFEEVLNKTRETNKSKKVIYGTEWCDENYAKLLNPCGKLSTDKEINWNATGNNELTSEQISYLKKNYNIENMSCQDNYNLMSDLTEMDVISSEDCIRTHVKPVPMGLNEAIWGIDFFGISKYSFLQGNILESIDKHCEYSNSLLSYLDTKEFNDANSNLSLQSKKKYKKIVADDINCYNRLHKIYNLIKR